MHTQPSSRSSKDFAENELGGLRRQGYEIDECTQKAGDLVYVPGWWHHATLNLAETASPALPRPALP
jgi:hypothetical protein